MTTLDEVLAEVQKNNRVCPQPKKWNELYELLPMACAHVSKMTDFLPRGQRLEIEFGPDDYLMNFSN